MIVFVLTYYILFHYVLLLSPEILGFFFLLRDRKGMEPEERGDREEQVEEGETKTGI